MLAGAESPTPRKEMATWVRFERTSSSMLHKSGVLCRFAEVLDLERSSVEIDLFVPVRRH